MNTWLEAELNRIPPRGGVADAIRYTLGRWCGANTRCC
jgi:hypothetical protein